MANLSECFQGNTIFPLVYLFFNHAFLIRATAQNEQIAKKQTAKKKSFKNLSLPQDAEFLSA